MKLKAAYVMAKSFQMIFYLYKAMQIKKLNIRIKDGEVVFLHLAPLAPRGTPT